MLSICANTSETVVEVSSGLPTIIFSCSWCMSSWPFCYWTSPSVTWWTNCITAHYTLTLQPVSQIAAAGALCWCNSSTSQVALAW
jgi:hypothetical protein